MRTAVISLTDKGMEVAQRIAGGLPGARILAYNQDFIKLETLLPTLWGKYRALVFIMAAGIVVRHIAPYIKRKDVDPAVIVIDEQASFVIPILSGHLGGANALARELAHILQATPVITTATDLQGLTAPDEYARRLNWKIHPLNLLPAVNSHLLRQGRLKVFSRLPLAPDHPLRRDPNYEFLGEPQEMDEPQGDGEVRKVGILISPKVEDDQYLTLIPRVCSVGIGCRRGVSAEEVLTAIQEVFQTLRYSLHSIKGLYSIDLKAQERGLQEAAAALGVKFATFSARQIQATIDEYQLKCSPWVKQSVGVGGVCEPASLLGSKDGQLIVNKTSIGKVTIAVCQEKFIS